MFRFVLTAYLSLTTVFGPAFCCCLVESILSRSKHAGCCESKTHSLASSGKTSKHHDHKHGVGHNHHSHHTSKKLANEKSRPKDPAGPENRPCGCDHRHAKLIALKSDSTSLEVSSRNLLANDFDGNALSLYVFSDLDNPPVSPFAELRPALLFGREMLRAYQILRC